MKQTVVLRFLVIACLVLVVFWLLLQHEYINCLTSSDPIHFSCRKSQIMIFQQAIRDSNVGPQCYKEIIKVQSKFLQSEKIPIYVITPTYARLVQKAELTRLSYCLRLVPNIHWIVVEDSKEKTELVTNFLKKSMILYTHLNVKTPPEYKMKSTDPSWLKPRGVLQRNLGLQWLRTNLNANRDDGIIYFADDDNSYDLELFEEMRQTKKVSVWPVGLVGGLIVEKPLISNGKVVGWNTMWKTERMFPIDMAGFAINLKLILQHPEAQFNLSVPRGYQETYLLKNLITVEELEPKANNCSKILIWHTRTEMPKLKQEKKLKVPSNLNMEV